MRGIIKEASDLMGVMLSKPVWLCGLAMTLWGLNALSLQQVSFEHIGTIAVSHSRLPALQAIVQNGGSGTPYRVLSCELYATEPDSNHHWDMRTVKLRVRAKTYSDLLKLEEFLLRATHPKQDSPESQAIVQEIRKLRWVQESIAHQKLRLGIQKESIREQIAALASSNPPANLATTSPQSVPSLPTNEVSQDATGAYHLVGHRIPADSQSEPTDAPIDQTLLLAAAELESKALDSLGTELGFKEQSTQAALANLTERLTASRAHSAGYLSFTGAEDRKPVAMPVGGAKLFVASIVFASLWCLVGIAVQRGPDVARQLLGTFSVMPNTFANRTRNRSRQLELDLPCLGVIEIQAGFHASPHSGPKSLQMAVQDPSQKNQSRKKSNASFTEQPRLHSSAFNLPINVWLQNAATLAIATWGLLFGIRLLVDSVWRELFLNAPLAGLLHLLIGAP